MRTDVRLIATFAAVLGVGFLSIPLRSEPIASSSDINTLATRTDLVPIKTADETVLRSTILLPHNYGKERLSTILILTPYLPDNMIKEFRQLLARQLQSGYAVAIVNERGTYYSSGNYSLLSHSKNDGTDVINWITKQPWSDGKVGMLGCSAPGEVQHGLNMDPPKGLLATVPISSGAGLGKIGPYNEQAGFYRGGAFQTGSWWFEWYRGKGQEIRPRFPENVSDDELRNAAKLWTLEPDLSSSFDIRQKLWTLPTNAIMRSIGALPTDMDKFVNRLPNDPAWSKLSLGSDEAPYRTPMLMINAWYDAAVDPNVALYSYQKDHADPKVRDLMYMVVAPTRHCAMLRDPVPPAKNERDLGNYRLDYMDLIARWFDATLKGKSDAMKGVPKVQAYMMGVNEWRSYDTWPPRAAKNVNLFLSSIKGANGRLGDGELQYRPASKAGIDKYVYDWKDPVPSLGGSLNIRTVPGGSFDQSEIELRKDVLVYTTQPLKEKLEVAGPIKVQVYLSSDVPDTDLTIKLLDVYPDGRAFNLDDTIQRVRWRDGWSHPEFMTAGNVYRVELGPLVTSNAFLPGHRIRIEVSSSNFPRYERNLNTGRNNYDESTGNVANNVIHFGAGYPSKISLPVLK